MQVGSLLATEFIRTGGVLDGCLLNTIPNWYFYYMELEPRTSPPISPTSVFPAGGVPAGGPSNFQPNTNLPPAIQYNWYVGIQAIQVNLIGFSLRS